VYAGNAYGNAEIQTPVKVVSVRQSEFSAAEPSGGNSPSENVAVALSMRRLRASNRLAGGRRASGRIWARRRSSFRAGAPSRSALPRCSIRWPTCSARAVRCKPRGVRPGYAPPELQVAKPVRGGTAALFRHRHLGRDSALGGKKGSKEHRGHQQGSRGPDLPSADYRLGARPFTAVPELITEIEKG